MAYRLRMILGATGLMAVLTVAAGCSPNQPSGWSGASAGQNATTRPAAAGPYDVNQGYYQSGRTRSGPASTGP